MSGSGAQDAGFSSVVPPEMATPDAPSVAGLGTTWVVAGAMVVLLVIYAHWHTY